MIDIIANTNEELGIPDKMIDITAYTNEELGNPVEMIDITAKTHEANWETENKCDKSTQVCVCVCARVTLNPLIH